MLTPEQKQALMNAKALIQEIEAMEGGSQEGDAPADKPEAQEAQMAFNPDEQMGDQPEGENATQPKDEKKQPEVKESFTKKTYKDISQMATPDASTARDKAEDKVDDIPDQDEENIGEVAKALATIARSLQAKNVAKSATPTGSELVGVINELTKVVKSMMETQKNQGAVLEDVLEGLGVAKSIEAKQEALRVEKSNERRPVATTDTNQVLLEVTKALQAIAGNKGDQTYTVGNNSSDVRKSLAENIEALLPVRY
jgi:hypothetical protein